MSLSPDCATLLEHVPADGSSIGNLKLRDQLGWDEERYAVARQPLLDLGVLETGRGRGGAVKRSVSREGDESEASSAQASLALEETPSAPKATASRQPAASRNGGSSQFEQTFRNIDDVMWKDSGCTSELDYSEQSSWLLFLKYLDSLEHSKAQEAALEGRAYTHILDAPYRWSTWAAPKDAGGKIDHNRALSGDDLRDFVNQKLFPYLEGFKQRASGPDTIEYKIGEIFGEIRNKIQSGYNLREIIDHVDELRFGSQKEKHELSHLYETKIKNMGNAGRNGGEYYTPRPLIRAVVQVINPKIGETIYDGACGSAGFHCEAFEYLRSTGSRTTRDLEILQKRTFYGKQKKSLAYVIGVMNMILHGIEAPNIIHTNTLAEFIKLQKTFADSPKSWSVDVKAIDPKTFDLSVKNPDGGEEITHRSPADIMQEIAKLDAESAAVLGKIKELL